MGLEVRDVMQTRVKTVGPEARLTDVERTLLRQRIGSLPVVRDGVLVGVISRSDVVKHLQAVQSQVESALSAYGDDEGDEETIASQRAQTAGAVASDRADAQVEDAMTRDVVSTTPAASLAEAARLMVERRVHRLPVLEDGVLRGLLSTVDLARLVAEGRLAPR